MKFQQMTRNKTCPSCGGMESYRIKREGVFVKLVCGLMNVRPHYCPTCDVYYFGPRHSGQLKGQMPLQPHGETRPSNAHGRTASFSR